MTPEAKIKREICDYLASFPDEFEFTLTPGIQAGKKRARSKYMPKGWPDITGVWRKRSIFVNAYGTIRHVIPFFIEVKAIGGVASEEQDSFIKKMSSWGCVALVASSVSEVANRFHGHEAHP